MELKELILILVGAVTFLWAMASLNSFIGGSNSTGSLLMFWGTPALIGIGVIFFGIVAYAYVGGQLKVFSK